VIEKILSAGRDGAERAAIDAALELGIHHGGSRYDPDIVRAGLPTDISCNTEAPSADYRGCIEENVKNSDGTLIITLGRPEEYADHARKTALRNRRQLLHVDASSTDVLEAASLIRSWIDIYFIRTLHVTGVSSENVSSLYQATFHILMNAVSFPTAEGPPEDTRPYPLPEKDKPRTVEQAIERLLYEMPLKDKTTLARMRSDELAMIHSSLAEFIVVRFGLGPSNSDLMKSCCFHAKQKEMDVNQASAILVRSLWERLQKTHSLRIVKKEETGGSD